MEVPTTFACMITCLILGTLWTEAKASRISSLNNDVAGTRDHEPSIAHSDEERLEEQTAHPPVKMLIGHAAKPPDARGKKGKTIFKPGLNVFLEPEAHSWACDRFNATNTSSKVKAILSSDLFSSGKDLICPTLSRMLGYKTGDDRVKAFWINDARAGWQIAYVVDAWVRDGLWEREQFKQCGIGANAALWINRWDVPGSNMTLAKDLRKGTLGLAIPEYLNTTIEEVKKEIDESAVLYMPGGNPYTLLRLTQDGPGKEILQHALARVQRGDMVYVSRSAGTIAAGVNINVSKDPKGHLENMSGFNLFSEAKLTIRPHYDDTSVSHGRKWRADHDQMEWSQADMLDSLSDRHGYNGIALKDGEFVAIYEGNIAVTPSGTRGSRPLNETIEVVDQDLKKKYTCVHNQGTPFAAYRYSGRSSFNACAILCEEDSQCGAFDYTTDARSGHWNFMNSLLPSNSKLWLHDSCRLYKTDSPREHGDSGFQKRRYCAKKNGPSTETTTTTTERLDPDLQKAFTCTINRGPKFLAYNFSSRNSFNSCGSSCALDPGCASFDYTTDGGSSRLSLLGMKYSANACRLYHVTEPRNASPGDIDYQNRKHCAKNDLLSTVTTSTTTEMVYPVLEEQFECARNQGPRRKAYNYSLRNSFNSCGSLCAQDSSCLAFDYTLNSESGHRHYMRWTHNACRLYHVSEPREPVGDGGPQNRKHCKKKYTGHQDTAAEGGKKRPTAPTFPWPFHG